MRPKNNNVKFERLYIEKVKKKEGKKAMGGEGMVRK